MYTLISGVSEESSGFRKTRTRIASVTWNFSIFCLHFSFEFPSDAQTLLEPSEVFNIDCGCACSRERKIDDTSLLSDWHSPPSLGLRLLIGAGLQNTIDRKQRGKWIVLLTWISLRYGLRWLLGGTFCQGHGNLFSGFQADVQKYRPGITITLPKLSTSLSKPSASVTCWED